MSETRPNESISPATGRAEAEYLTRQGGFSASTWGYVFQLVGEYREHRNLGLGEAIIEVTLRTGQTVAIDGVRAAFGWVVLLGEDDSMRIVPHREVVAIHVHRRPGPPTEKQRVGFTYEPS
jgi:hypothetical protein